MKDPKDKQTGDLLRSANAERQARLKARREAAGFRHSTIWIHAESERQGFEWGKQGRKPWPPPDDTPADPVSYFIGWVKGNEEHLIPTQCAHCGDVKEIPQREGYSWLGQELGDWYCSRRCEREALEESGED